MSTENDAIFSIFCISLVHFQQLITYELFFVVVFRPKQHYAGDYHRTAIRGTRLLLFFRVTKELVHF